MQRINAGILQTTAIGAVLALGLWASPAALAQEAPAPAPTPAPEAEATETAESEETIVVTGSRLKVPDYDRSGPVSSVTGAQIQQAGVVNLTDFLQEVPALVNSFDSEDSADTGGQAQAGLNLLNLRNLGEDRTLVLVDGRRHVAGSPGSQAVDINMIPLALIERIEVLTGGASAIYGADGVSGVVNFVMKRDFEGAAGRVQIGGSEQGGADSAVASMTVGANFDDDKGNITLSAEVARTTAVTSADRDFSFPGRRLNLARNPNDIPDDPNVYDRVLLSDLRYIDTAPGGAVYTSAFAGPTISGVSFRGDGQPWTDGISNGGFTMIGGDGTLLDAFVDELLPEEDRDLFAMTARYEFDKAFEVFAEAKYAQTRTSFTAQPTFDYGIAVPLDNAYIPQAIVDDALQNIIDGVGLDNFGLGDYVLVGRDNIDLGATGRDIQRETYRTVLGARGDLTDWLSYELSYVWGQTEEISTYRNNRINERWFAAIDAVVDPGTGDIVCRSDLDPGAIPLGDVIGTAGFDGSTWGTTFTPGPNSGCVPINIFGENVSPEGAAWINTTSTGRSVIEQNVVTGYMSAVSTPWFELPGGPISMAAGFEYRDESSKSFASPIELLGTDLGYDVSWGGQGSNTIGSFDVTEGFVEASIPLLAEMPFAEELTFDGAYRWSDYSTAGSVEAWKAGVKWRPDNNVMLRGTIATSVRAPNISELFLPQTQTFALLTDPCDDDEIGLNALRTANCIADGVPPGYNDTSSSAAEGRIGGNPDLLTETADTYTFGIVLTPEFIPGLNIAVDYYNIELSDAIQFFTAQTIFDKCYDLPRPNQFCGLIQRDPGTFRIDSFQQFALNVAKYETSGVDFSVRYRLDPADLGVEEDIGIFNFAIAGNRLYNLTFTELSDAEPDEDAGEPGAPKWQVVFDVTWVYEDWSVNYGFSYFSKTQRVDPAAIDLNPDYSDPRFFKYDERFTHDIQVAYRLNENVEIYGGVNNFTNQEPDPGSLDQPVSPRGRYYYLGVSVDFDSLGVDL